MEKHLVFITVIVFVLKKLSAKKTQAHKEDTTGRKIMSQPLL